MKVELKIKRTAWCWLEMEVTDEDYEILCDGDLSPVWENDEVCKDYVERIFDLPYDVDEEIEELKIIK